MNRKYFALAITLALLLWIAGGDASPAARTTLARHAISPATDNPSSPTATTWYVRSDGGSLEQCTGLVDAPYPGSGTNQPCAWDHPFRALQPSGEPDVPGTVRIAGGDTLIIGAGSYMMGYGAPGADNCESDYPWDCHIPPIPSGPSPSQPTRILGTDWDSGCSNPPGLWGTERANMVLNLTDSSNVEIACLDVTDHAGCVESHTGGLACERDTYPFGGWAVDGLYAEDSTNVSLKNLNIHGLAAAGVRAGRLTDWTVEDVRIAGNGWVGWDGDIEGNDSNAGTMTFRRWAVAWNGCAETWPGEEPTGCWGQSVGGYGDGVGTGETGGHWIIEDSVFRHNTSDGLDLLYTRRPDSQIEIRRTIAEGNAGDQFKTTGPTLIENAVAVSNCGFFEGQPFTFNVDNCRAGGSAIALTLRATNHITVVNSTITGQGDCLVIAECAAGETCTGSESVLLRNDIFQGNSEFGQPGDTTCLAWYGTASDPFDIDYAIINGVKADLTPCPDHSLCNVAPGVVNASIDAFDAHLLSDSPAIDAGTASGAPSDDFDGLPRDATPDIGAYEWRTGAATPTQTPTPTGTPPTPTQTPTPTSTLTPTATVSADLDLYGTFHAMGVIVSLEAGGDPNGDAAAMVEYRAGDESYRAGFPLSRASDTRFAGSLFWLEPGTAYDVRVTLSDPDGEPLDGVTLESTATTRAEIAIPGPNRSYYAAPDGSGTACTLAAPCSLTEGINQAQAGDEVVLRGGVYYQGEIDLPRSGTAGAPIVIRSYQGENAILDGADPAVFTWADQGGGVYRATVNVANPHLVTADGKRLLPYQSLSDLQSLSWGVPGFYADDTTVHVHLAGDADPNAATMVVSRENYAFYVEQDHIYFADLTFRHYGQGSWAKAIYFNNASHNLVQGCTFAINDLGIGIKRDSHRNVIQDNEFYDTIFDWPWGAFYAGIELSSGGITFYDPATGRGNVIRRNTFHDLFDGFDVCPWTAGVTNETDVYDNLVYNAGDDGMETDGRCSNVRIWDNTFHDVLMGISLAPVYDGPVYAIRNLIYRTGAGNNSYTGSPFKFNSGYGQSGPMYLFHNTADAVLSGNNGLYIKAPGSWDLIYARNNIWAGTVYALDNYNTGQPLDLDYDDLYTASGDDLIRWNSTRYATLAEFTAGTGQEPHGLNVEPGFTDATSGDYTLESSSNLIDAGVVIPGINDQGPHAYQGLAPDIGAYEYAPCTLTEDVNGDGQVDVTDIQLVADAWHQIPAPDYADRDGDGDVDVVDVMRVCAHWGERCS